jgi:uncharacterized protein
MKGISLSKREIRERFSPVILEGIQAAHGDLVGFVESLAVFEKSLRMGAKLKSNSVVFPCNELTLEGEWLIPDGDGPFPVVVVCHPHPQFGGDMHNGVSAAIWQGLAEHSIAAFRFNFRGVGKSQGSFGKGLGEQGDVRAALEFISSSPITDNQRIGLAGYSFGAMVALQVALKEERVIRLALVSPPLSDKNWEQLRDYRNPKLFLVGDSDHFTPAERVFQEIKDVPDPGSYQIITGADHFLGGYEEEVAQRVARFFAAGFNK